MILGNRLGGANIREGEGTVMVEFAARGAVRREPGGETITSIAVSCRTRMESWPSLIPTSGQDQGFGPNHHEM